MVTTFTSRSFDSSLSLSPLISTKYVLDGTVLCRLLNKLVRQAAAENRKLREKMSKLMQAKMEGLQATDDLKAEILVRCLCVYDL